MLISILRAVNKLIFNEMWKGKKGENLIEQELTSLCNRGFGGKVLRNVYIPKENGGTSEIDLLYLTRKGIFALESKNYSGTIIGKYDEKNWSVKYPGGRKETLYNPFWQNDSHIRALKRYLGRDIPFYSIVVFSNKCHIRVKTGQMDQHIVQRKHLKRELTGMMGDLEDVMPEWEIEQYYERLQSLTNVSGDVKRNHIQEAKAAKRGGFTSKARCPICHKPLVLKTARKGQNAGKQFYGCSGFPACRYTI